jgi:hypothetical protein
MDLSSIKSLYELDCGYRLTMDEQKSLIALLLGEAEGAVCPHCGGYLDRLDFVERTVGEIILTKDVNYAHRSFTETAYACPLCHGGLRLEDLKGGGSEKCLSVNSSQSGQYPISLSSGSLAGDVPIPVSQTG